jgi:predicted enzyme related to lactoylglutathione lyase
VSDLAKSIAFYTGPMSMTRAGELKRDDRIETVLTPKSFGIAIALMQFTDGKSRNFKNNPVKIVFAVADADAASKRITDAGYTFSVPGLFAQDPDGYTIELNARMGADYGIAAFGIGVADSAKATDSFALALALVHYSDPGHNYKDSPVKLVFNVANVAASLQHIPEAGGMIVAQPTVVPTLGNATVGIAKDADGYTLELMQH